MFNVTYINHGIANPIFAIEELHGHGNNAHKSDVPYKGCEWDLLIPWMLGPEALQANIHAVVTREMIRLVKGRGESLWPANV